MGDKPKKIKSDKFKKSRGGYSRWLLLSCENCKVPLLVYQKDGQGILKRLYLDRIVAPKMQGNQNLVCKKCKTVIGTPMVYKKEKRAAYRLYVGAIVKKLVNADKLNKIIAEL